MSSSSPILSPSSDKQFWSTLHSRIETLIDNPKTPVDSSFITQKKEDSMLLLRGFDSVAQSLSQLSNNLENALKGARDLARSPTLTEIVHATLEKAKTEEKTLINEENKDEQKEEDNEEEMRGLKRKMDSENQGEDSKKTKVKSPQELGKFKNAKRLAISMATKAASLARELKSIRSDLSFVQDRCALLEEENNKIRDGLAKGIRPDDEDLVRLQLEALLAEKSRLANENANFTRENECLYQLVEYHQQTSEDLSESYEKLTRGMCLDFSSPLETNDGSFDNENRKMTMADGLGFRKSLDECYAESMISSTMSGSTSFII